MFAINCDNSDAQGALNAYMEYNGPGGSGTLYPAAPLDLSALTTVDEWSRVALEFDATGIEATVAALTLYWLETGTTTVSPTFWIDGVELLDVTDFPSITEDNFPTHWIPPTGSTSGAVGLEGGARILAGDDSPEGVVTASPGSTYHDNANGNVYMKASGTSTTGWVQVASTSSVAQTKVADSDSANSSSTTLTDDAALAGFDVLAATEYLLEAELRFTTANDASDLKYSWQFSQTPQAAAGFLVDEGGTGVTDGTVSSVTLTSTSTRNSSGGSDYVLRVSARVLGHATLAATMDFQWARDNASGTTTRKAGSWMRLTPT